MNIGEEEGMQVCLMPICWEICCENFLMERDEITVKLKMSSCSNSSCFVRTSQKREK